jgi:hypothetical protein
MQTPPLDWHKASLCQTGECVEIATFNDTVVMRSSARPESSGYLYVTPEDFSTFIQAAKAGRFDLARLATGR